MVSFVMKIKNITYPEALENIAFQEGIHIDYSSDRKEDMEQAIRLHLHL